MQKLLGDGKRLSTTTDSEILLNQAFVYINVYEKHFFVGTGELYCFKCQRLFGVSGDTPEYCLNCGNDFRKKGSHAKPDFVLRYQKERSEPHYILGIVRVDGGIHKHSKRHANPDYHQVMKFREQGIRVFIVNNDELSKKYPDENIVVADRIKLYMQAPDEVYERYFRSKAVQENVVRFR